MPTCHGPTVSRAARCPWLGLGLAVLILGVGCAQNRGPTALDDLAAQAEKAGEDEAAHRADAAGEGSGGDAGTSDERAEEETADDPSVILIEKGATSANGKSTLWEAAVAARESKQRARPPVAQVTNENLHEYQDAELTFVEPDARKGSGKVGEGGEELAPGEATATADRPAEEGAEAEELEPEARGEQYWRAQVLDIRLRLRTAVDEIEDLEAEVESLRRSFYAEDDPYIRDGRIKPAWDRAIGRLANTRRRVERLRQELSSTLEKGRRAGALPGWLREGIELEPSPERQDAAVGDAGYGLEVHQAEEPSTVEPGELPNTNPDEPPP